MNEALQGISSEVQQLLWQMQTEVVIEAIKDLRLARLPAGSYSSLRRGSNLDGLPHLENSGPSGKLPCIYIHISVFVQVPVHAYVHMYLQLYIHMYVHKLGMALLKFCVVIIIH